MKYIVLFVLLVTFDRSFGQNLSDYDYNKVRIIDSGALVQAELLPYTNPPKPKIDRIYYWYNANQIHATQGGFTGKLLNGNYTSFYPNKSLREQGDFEKGLKQGIWKNWDASGKLIKTSYWDEGVEVKETAKPFWKKLNLFPKKPDEAIKSSN